MEFPDRPGYNDVLIFDNWGRSVSTGMF